jgi:hypothetical protein
MMLIADNGTSNFVPPTLVCTYILEIMTEKWFAHYLHVILVDVMSKKGACYATREAAIFAVCIRGVLEFPFKCGKTRNGVPIWVN